LSDWDEAVYAQVAKEMVGGSGWLTLHYDFKPWFEKPPLLIWITAIFYKLFAINEFWARAASAASGVALIGLTYRLGEVAYNRWVAALASLILLSSREFIFRSRFGTMDVMLTLFSFFAIFGYLRLRQGSDTWWYLVWGSWALAVMAKGAAAVVAPAAIFLALTVEKVWGRALRSRRFWYGLLLAVLIAAPWHIAMLLQHGREFLRSYVGVHVLARSFTALESGAGGRLSYVIQLQEEFFPWFYLLPFALALTLRNNLPRRAAQSWILLYFPAVVFLLYTAVRTKHSWYSFPVYPAFAILIAAVVVEGVKRRDSIALSGLLMTGFLGVLGASPRVLEPLTALASLGILVIGVLWLRTRKFPWRSLGVLCCLLSIALSLQRVVWVLQDRTAGWTPAARLASRAGSIADKQPLFLLGNQPGGGLAGPTILYYSNRYLQRVASPAELGDFITRDGPLAVIFIKRDLPELSSSYHVRALAEEGNLEYAEINRLY